MLQISGIFNCGCLVRRRYIGILDVHGHWRRDKDKVLLLKVINLPTVKTNMYTDIDIFKTSFFFLVFEMKKEWK